MNAVFIVLTLASSISIMIFAPSEFIPALLLGAREAAECALTLFCAYAGWMGLSAVAEEARLTSSFSRLLRPVCRKVFKTRDEEATKFIALNISCNLLGIGGAATPYAVKAVSALEKEKNEFAQNLLFVINAAGVQLIPATVIALRAAENSANAYDIALPTFLCSFICAAIGTALYLLFYKILKR